MGHDDDKWGYLPSRRVTCLRNLRGRALFSLYCEATYVPVAVWEPVPSSRDWGGLPWQCYHNKTTASYWLLAPFLLTMTFGLPRLYKVPHRRRNKEQNGPKSKRQNPVTLCSILVHTTAVRECSRFAFHSVFLEIFPAVHMCIVYIADFTCRISVGIFSKIFL
jgi:hypothetical protein